jgi:hypothetical protein
MNTTIPARPRTICLAARHLLINCAIGSAVVLAAAAHSAFAMQSSNPVCGAIEAEGSSCAGGGTSGNNGAGGQASDPARNPIKDFWAPNFPRVDQSGPSAKTPTDLRPGFLGGQPADKPKRPLCQRNLKTQKRVCLTEPL